MAEQFVVLKRIPRGAESIPAGEIVDASEWRNLRSLVANGYIIPLADDADEVLAQTNTLRRGGPRAQASLLQMREKARQAREQEDTSSSDEVEEVLEENTKDELYEEAQEQDIEGRSSMKKDELAEAVVEADAEVETEAQTEDEDEVVYSTETEAEAETKTEVAAEDALDQYHTGHGWYEVPGHDSKVRREEALLLLSESESPPSDEE